MQLDRPPADSLDALIGRQAQLTQAGEALQATYKQIKDSPVRNDAFYGHCEDFARQAVDFARDVAASPHIPEEMKSKLGVSIDTQNNVARGEPAKNVNNSEASPALIVRNAELNLHEIGERVSGESLRRDQELTEQRRLENLGLTGKETYEDKRGVFAKVMRNDAIDKALRDRPVEMAEIIRLEDRRLHKPDRSLQEWGDKANTLTVAQRMKAAEVLEKELAYRDHMKAFNEANHREHGDRFGKDLVAQRVDIIVKNLGTTGETLAAAKQLEQALASQASPDMERARQPWQSARPNDRPQPQHAQQQGPQQEESASHSPRAPWQAARPNPEGRTQPFGGIVMQKEGDVITVKVDSAASRNGLVNFNLNEHPALAGAEVGSKIHCEVHNNALHPQLGTGQPGKGQGLGRGGV